MVFAIIIGVVGKRHNFKRVASMALVVVVAFAAMANDYFIDESKSLAEVSALKLLPGDRVLFKRGCVWRGSLVPCSGEPDRPIFYGAYGEGEKPILQASMAKNSISDWRSAANGLWQADVGNEKDIGNIVFEHGAAGCAFKRDKLADVKGELDFWHDAANCTVLLRSDRNPAERFRSVELCGCRHAVTSVGGHDIVFDGLWVRACLPSVNWRS